MTVKSSYRSELWLITFRVTPREEVNYLEWQWPKPDKFFGDGQSTINVALTAPSLEEADEILRDDYKQPPAGNRDRTFDGMVSRFDLSWTIKDITELDVDVQGLLRS